MDLWNRWVWKSDGIMDDESVTSRPDTAVGRVYVCN